MKFSERHLRAERQIFIVTFIRRNYAIATLKAGPERIVYTIFGDHTSGVAIITWEGIRSVCPRRCMEPAPGPEGQTESLRTEVTN